jgi:hypothetical protein
MFRLYCILLDQAELYTPCRAGHHTMHREDINSAARPAATPTTRSVDRQRCSAVPSTLPLIASAQDLTKSHQGVGVRLRPHQAAKTKLIALIAVDPADGRHGRGQANATPAGYLFIYTQIHRACRVADHGISCQSAVVLYCTLYMPWFYTNTVYNRYVPGRINCERVGVNQTAGTFPALPTGRLQSHALARSTLLCTAESCMYLLAMATPHLLPVHRVDTGQAGRPGTVDDPRVSAAMMGRRPVR